MNKAVFFTVSLIGIPLISFVVFRDRGKFLAYSSIAGFFFVTFNIYDLALSSDIKDLDIIFELGVIFWALAWVAFFMLYYWIHGKLIVILAGIKNQQ